MTIFLLIYSWFFWNIDLVEWEREKEEKRNATIEMRDDKRFVSAEKTHGIRDRVKDSSNLK